MKIKEENTLNTPVFSRLPQSLPAKKLGRQYKKIAGYVKMQALARVTDLLASASNHDSNDIFIELEFNDIGKNKIEITSSINHHVTVVCQRCMQQMPYDIVTNIKLLLVNELSSDNGMAGDHERVVMDFRDKLDLYQIVEDELILSLPSVIKHDELDKRCSQENTYVL